MKFRFFLKQSNKVFPTFASPGGKETFGPFKILFSMQHERFNCKNEFDIRIVVER